MNTERIDIVEKVERLELVEALFPVRDLPILDIILEHRGVIFGGYLRDLFAGLEPNDIDVTFYQKYAEDILLQLTILYGQPPRMTGNGEGVFTNGKLRNLEFFISENDFDTVDSGDAAEGGEINEHYYIGALCDPDFDVNKLTYQRKNIEGAILYDWSTGSTKSKEIDHIIEACRNRQATIMSNDIPYDRLEKMSNKKEWTILPFTPSGDGDDDDDGNDEVDEF